MTVTAMLDSYGNYGNAHELVEPIVNTAEREMSRLCANHTLADSRLLWHAVIEALWLREQEYMTIRQTKEYKKR